MKQSPKVLVTAIILASVSVVFVKFYIHKQIGVSAKVKIPVVQATTDIERGTTISARMVKQTYADLPAQELDYVKLNKSYVVGQKAVENIKKGIYIPVYAVTGGATGTRFSDKIAYDRKYYWRAITIPVDMPSGVGGYIQPGDRVDVIVTAQNPGYRKNVIVFKTWTILEDVKVLAVGEISEPTYFSLSNRYTNVTLEVTQEQAVILTFIRSATAGRFSLSLRNPEDTRKIGKSAKNINYSKLWEQAQSLSQQAKKIKREGR